MTFTIYNTIVKGLVCDFYIYNTIVKGLVCDFYLI